VGVAHATVLGPGEEGARSAEARPSRPRVLSRLAEEASEPDPALVAVRRGRPGEPEAAREPAEERREELRAPAPEALPRTPDRADIDRQLEERSHRVPSETLDEVQP